MTHCKYFNLCFNPLLRYFRIYVHFNLMTNKIRISEHAREVYTMEFYSEFPSYTMTTSGLVNILPQDASALAVHACSCNAY